MKRERPFQLARLHVHHVNGNPSAGMTTNNLTRATLLAHEYRALCARGDYALADQVERTIDDLIGRWTHAGRFMWPKPIAHTAGLSAVRRRIMRRSANTALDALL